MTAAVLMLQPFAGKCGAARGCAEQKSARLLVGSRPDQISHPLKAKHRVINVERQHGQAVHAVAGCRRGPAGDCTCFADAFFKDLAIERLAIRKHRTDVFRRVTLADAGINSDLLEQVCHAKSARLIRHNRHDARAECRVLEQIAHDAHERHRGAHRLAVRRERELRVLRDRRHRQHRSVGKPFWQITAQRFTLGVQIPKLRAVSGGLVERQCGGLFITERQVETVPEFEQGRLIQFFLRVRGHLALASAAHAVALFGVRQNHRRLAGVLRCGRIRCVDLDQIMAAAFQPVNLLVGHALRQTCQRFVLPEKMLAVVAAVAGGKRLHLAVHGVGERVKQRVALIASKKPVPIRAPHQLDNIPAGPTEQFFQLINDAAIATYRAVEPLQIAVDHPHQIVEALAGGQRQRAHAFRLVHLAIAEHAPYLAGIAIEQVAMGQIAHETRLINRADRPDAHRAGGELPEVRHQHGMRVARQAARAGGNATELAPIKVQVNRCQSSFEKRPRIHTRRAVRLEEHQVATVRRVSRMKEMIKADLKQVGSAGVTGDMSAELAIRSIRTRHHRQRIPAHDRAKPLFHGKVARKRGLIVNRNRVLIGCAQLRLPAYAFRPREGRQLIEHECGPIRTVRRQKRVERIQPFTRL